MFVFLKRTKSLMLLKVTSLCLKHDEFCAQYVLTAITFCFWYRYGVEKWSLTPYCSQKDKNFSIFSFCRKITHARSQSMRKGGERWIMRFFGQLNLPPLPRFTSRSLRLFAPSPKMECLYL